jgi:signal transduction histidine kinase
MKMSVHLLHARAAKQEDARLKQMAANIHTATEQMYAFVLEFLANSAADHGLKPPFVSRSTMPKQPWAGAICRVRDQGPGFSAEDQRQMFTRYQRLSALPTSGEPSTGLGLSIVRKLVGAMGGDITCRDACR